MATYKVQAPDGKVITLEGPDGASQDEILSQAQSLYQPEPVSTPAPPAAPKAVAPPKPAAAPKAITLTPTVAKSAWDKGSAVLEQKIANLPAAAQKIARDRFFADPRVAKLREASAVSTTAPEQRARQTVPGGRTLADRQRGRVQAQRFSLGVSPVTAPIAALASDDFVNAMSAGGVRGMFGVPERLAAGVGYLGFNPEDKPYSNFLSEIRGEVDADRERSLAGDIAGQVGSGAALGAPIAAPVAAVGRTLLQGNRFGQALRGAATAYPKSAKIASFAGAGAAGGAAQSAGEGSDISTGATYGAVGGPVLLGLGKAAGFVLRPVVSLLKSPSAEKILRRFTTATTEEMQRAADDFRARTGAEPTLYEVLPLADRNRVATEIVGRHPAVSEHTAQAVGQRVANVGPEMNRTVQNATGARRAQILAQMEQDLATARGGTADPGDAALAARAATSPADMEALRATEASATMAPVDQMFVAGSLQDMFPRSLVRNEETGEVSEVFSDPELNALLNRAAGAMRLRLSPDDPSAAVAGLSVNDITRLIDKLGDIHPASPDFLTSQRAINHLLDEMPPQARELTDQMRAAYAARSRNLEGMAEGARTRTRESVPVESRQQGQTVGNAYDSPEGTTGRFLGQSNALGREFSGAPRDVLRTAGQIAESGQTQAALGANLSPGVADIITGAAEAQARSVRNLASVGKESGREADSLDLEDLGRMVLALNPASMPTTKLFAISRLTTLARMPERKAQAIVDMLFSQDPAVTNRAIGLLNNAGRAGKAFLLDMAKSLAGGAVSSGVGQAASAVAPMADSYTPPEIEDTAPTEAIEAGDYAAVLDEAYASEDPEFIDLWQRQTGQESGRQQFDANGQPLTSSAGAIGIAQVMPGTGPEAAELAGLPWDENAYRQDAAYNELLGMAYMKHMLEIFDGDQALALAAYNAGPQAVLDAGGVPNYPETRDYVSRIMSGA